MTPDLPRIQDTRTTARTAPRRVVVDALRGTMGWYWDTSGGFIPETPDTWNPQVAFLVFPRITSSPQIERRDIGRFAVSAQHISTLPVARQVRELQTALSVNKSELARILRVSRPTVYDWLDDGEPKADNASRIRTLLRLLSEARVSASNPLFPRFVRAAVEPGIQVLLDLLCEETIAEATAKEAIHRAKALGDAMDSQRKEREARLRAAGFEEPDAGQQRKADLARLRAIDRPRRSGDNGHNCYRALCGSIAEYSGNAFRCQCPQWRPPSALPPPWRPDMIQLPLSPTHHDRGRPSQKGSRNDASN